MTDERLEQIRARHKADRMFVEESRDIGELLAEVRRLRADDAAMRAAFADACIDKDILRLAREDGRLEALRWAMKGIEPDIGGYAGETVSIWRRAGIDDSAVLPGAVFDRLEGGVPIMAHGQGTRPYRRDYPSPEAAFAALEAALCRLAREWPAGEDAR